MYENRYLQITTQGSQFYLNIRDYHIHKDFFSTIIENMFSFSGSKVNHAKNNIQAIVAADEIISLEQILKFNKMTPEYYNFLFKSLAEQLHTLQTKGLTILQYNPKHIFMFKTHNDVTFFYLYPDDIYKINMERIIIDSPFKITNFTAPELTTMKTIPNNKHNKTASFWSLAALITHCLSKTHKIKRPKTQSDFNNILKKIKYSKLYWALKRCFEKDPSHREMIYI
jgi:hypothetical protein